MEVPIIGSSSRTQTPQKWYFFTKSKESLTEKVSSFLNKINTTKKNVKKITVTKQVKKRLSKKIAQNISKKLTLNLCHQAPHRKM